MEEVFLFRGVGGGELCLGVGFGDGDLGGHVLIPAAAEGFDEGDGGNELLAVQLVEAALAADCAAVGIEGVEVGADAAIVASFGECAGFFGLLHRGCLIGECQG